MIPDNVEMIIMTKKDYDRNVEQLLLEKIKLEQKINEANEILQTILVVSNGENNYRPVKNTTKQDVYKAICELYRVLDTPYRSKL